MHELVEDVLPYFLALYVLDSLLIPRLHEFVLASPWRTALWARGPLLAGLAPWADVQATVDLPVRLGADAVGWPTVEGHTAIPWAELGPLAVERRSLRSAQHGVELNLPSELAVREVAALLAKLRDAPDRERWALAAKLLAERADLDAARARLALHARGHLLLAILGSAQLAIGFGALPLTVLGALEGGPAVELLVALLAVLHLITLAVGLRTLRRLGSAWGAALERLVTPIFFPPAASHLRSFLFRELWTGIDPLTLAALRLPRQDFLTLARERWHRLRVLGEAEPEWREHVELHQRVWRRVVEQAGESESAALRAPDSVPGSAGAYCPLCSAAYRSGFSQCSDCRSGLLPLDPAAATGS